MNFPAIISLIMSPVMALLAMAFYTLMERKFLGYFQLRKGPNKVSVTGIPQPFADAIKLFLKERATPTMSNIKMFYVAPMMGLVLTLMLWAIYPHQNTPTYITFGVLYFLCVSSMNVYVVFVSGWCSNSKYALLGALRGIAQTISYEVTMALILINALMIMFTMDLHVISNHMMSWITMMLLPISMMWFITNLAETNRTPFDLAEGESELVSGFNIEYSSGLFALVFMAEYANILMMSLLTTIFFTGKLMIMNNMFLILKTTLVATIFIWVRATLPRMRYDKLMYLTWKSFLPISLILIMSTSFMLSM